MIAIAFGTLDAVRALLKGGARIEVKNDQGLDALEVAKDGRREHFARYLDKVRIMKVLASAVQIVRLRTISPRPPPITMLNTDVIRLVGEALFYNPCVQL